LFLIESVSEFGIASAPYCKSDAPTGHSITANSVNFGNCSGQQFDMSWKWSATWQITNSSDPSHQCCGATWHGAEVYQKTSLGNTSQVWPGNGDIFWVELSGTIMCGTTWTERNDIFATIEVRPWDWTSTIVNTGLPGASYHAQAPTPVFHPAVQGPDRP
jgi:hypothetical protein